MLGMATSLGGSEKIASTFPILATIFFFLVPVLIWHVIWKISEFESRNGVKMKKWKCKKGRKGGGQGGKVGTWFPLSLPKTGQYLWFLPVLVSLLSAARKPLSPFHFPQHETPLFPPSTVISATYQLPPLSLSLFYVSSLYSHSSLDFVLVTNIILIDLLMCNMSLYTWLISLYI